jgi:hypothetical protein
MRLGHLPTGLYQSYGFQITIHISASLQLDQLKKCNTEKENAVVMFVFPYKQMPSKAM